MIFSRAIFLFLLTGNLVFAEKFVHPLLKKTAEFYKKYENQTVDRLKIFENDELSNLSKEDLDFLKSRIKVYGLAPFEIEESALLISLGPNKNTLKVDYSSIDSSHIIVQGIPYPYNLNQPLKKLFEVDYKKTLKKFKAESASLWQYPLFAFSLVGCVDTSGATAESAVNTSSVPLALLKVCVECTSIALNPQVALLGVGSAAVQGAYTGIKEKSIKACGKKFCEETPGLGSAIDVYRAARPSKQIPLEHSK